MKVALVSIDKESMIIYATDELVVYKISMISMSKTLDWRIFESTGYINSRNAISQQVWCRCGKVKLPIWNTI